MTEMENNHPMYPRSNILKFTGYQPEILVAYNTYALSNVQQTVRTDDCLTPGHSPCLTQQTVGMYLQPLDRELDEVPLRPTISDLPEAVIDKMVQEDKAFWLDKPGANAYSFHDACDIYGMTTEMMKPPHQDVFPRSYQYDLDCVRHRRQHGCDGTIGIRKTLNVHCRDCANPDKLHSITSSEVKNGVEGERWRYYPDLNVQLSPGKIREWMDEVGRPYKNEACNWYYRKYPPQKFDCILRKFSK